MSDDQLKTKAGVEREQPNTSVSPTHHAPPPPPPPRHSRRPASGETRSDVNARPSPKFSHHRPPPPPPRSPRKQHSLDAPSSTKKQSSSPAKSPLKQHSFPLQTDSDHSTTSEPSQKVTPVKPPSTPTKHHLPLVYGILHGETPLFHQITADKNTDTILPIRPRSKSISSPAAKPFTASPLNSPTSGKPQDRERFPLIRSIARGEKPIIHKVQAEIAKHRVQKTHEAHERTPIVDDEDWGVGEGRGFDVEEMVREDGKMMEETEEKVMIAKRIAGLTESYDVESSGSGKMVFATEIEDKKENMKNSKEDSGVRRRSANIRHGELPPLFTNTGNKAIGTKVMGEKSPTYLTPTTYSPFPDRIKETTFVATRRHSKQASLDTIDGMMSSKSSGKRRISIDNENPMTPDDALVKPKKFVSYVKIEESPIESPSTKTHGRSGTYRRHVASHSGTAKSPLDGSQKIEDILPDLATPHLESSHERPASSSPAKPTRSAASTAIRHTSTSDSSRSTTGITAPTDAITPHIPIQFHENPINPRDLQSPDPLSLTEDPSISQILSFFPLPPQPTSPNATTPPIAIPQKTPLVPSTPLAHEQKFNTYTTFFLAADTFITWNSATNAGLLDDTDDSALLFDEKFRDAFIADVPLAEPPCFDLPSPISRQDDTAILFADDAEHEICAMFCAASKLVTDVITAAGKRFVAEEIEKLGDEVLACMEQICGGVEEVPSGEMRVLVRRMFGFMEVDEVLRLSLHHVAFQKGLAIMASIILEGIEPRALSKPQKYLANLPREIVHLILKDVDIIKVLNILSYNHGYLNSCIVTSTKFGPLTIPYEPDSNDGQWIKDLANTTKLYILHLEICVIRKRAIQGPNSLTQLPLLLREHYDAWKADMHTDLRKRLADQIHETAMLDEYEKSVYLSHTTKPFPDQEEGRSMDLDILSARWRWIKETWISMGKAKCRQLNMAADILSEMPGRVALKKPLDPSQTPPSSADHIVRLLRGKGKRYAESHIPPHRRRPKCVAGAELIELVPYDRYLRIFLGALEKYPPSAKQLEADFDKLSLDNGADTPCVYPQSIMDDLEIAVKGLRYVYNRDPDIRIPRIQWNSFEHARRSNPTFAVGHSHHLTNSSPCPWCVAMHAAYDDREYEWLRAFLKVVWWMEQNLDIPDDFEVVESEEFLSV
ncbi:hypothetical protein GLAREA_04923 [Glarea lozoyensis ATCC 20868]|uniref:Uncharacterized protein n=1 Tax=Glarea lozoyensis (strain ATCC 20868 / MF5171) TaxID=1116229 RepID=S3CNN9_GLAL2|nr:uncharacterized protein GLAREA_04923 [Glarea lozoyensis ATCC 20868]EPE28132.1 hypothetical protein GLAREA_04923 [Glarea lozoyensis ATCC 20868]